MTQTLDELIKHMSKLPQQLKEMHESPQQSQIILCELASGDHPFGFFSPTDEEVNYIAN